MNAWWWGTTFKHYLNIRIGHWYMGSATTIFPTVNRLPISVLVQKVLFSRTDYWQEVIRMPESDTSDLTHNKRPSVWQDHSDREGDTIVCKLSTGGHHTLQEGMPCRAWGGPWILFWVRQEASGRFWAEACAMMWLVFFNDPSGCHADKRPPRPREKWRCQPESYCTSPVKSWWPGIGW